MASASATTDEAQDRLVNERASENAGRFELDPEVIRDVVRPLVELNKDERRNEWGGT